MKCLILAGGKGNSVWPLSRENYPKQFMNIKENRSLLQETIARNIPFCEEFLISSNVNYQFIIEGQMKKFQGLKYRSFLEEEGRKTAPAIGIISLLLNPSELIFVVSSDQIIEGENYKKAILEAIELAKQGYLVTFGLEPVSAHTGYGYILHEGNQVLRFIEKPDAEKANVYMESGEYLWNSGNFIFQAGDLLNELKKYSPEVFEKCQATANHLNLKSQQIMLPKEYFGEIPAVSIETAVFEKSDNVRVICPDFNWFDIGDLEQLSDYTQKGDAEKIILNNCNDLTVINRAENKLIVINDLEHISVINTNDALYISQKGSVGNIKSIMKRHHDEYAGFFENHIIQYRAWGNFQVLVDTPLYKVKRVTIYPGKSFNLHRHSMRSEQWTVVQGTATVTIEDKTDILSVEDCIQVPVNTVHTAANLTNDELIMVEISMGEKLIEEDTVSFEKSHIRLKAEESIVKLEPALKDYLWGGRRLKDRYGKECDYDIVAESWELSSHKDGQSTVASGKHKGMLFGEYLDLLDENALGWKCKSFDRFPILIKFIDAKEPLSIQVHPDDEYGLRKENEYGKNEMWYVMDCEQNSSIYYGVRESMTKEDLKHRVQNNTILESLNKVDVRKGDTYFVEAGTIHAIGGGILICEIQQNSNCTYRLYDYDRRDKYGNTRELHLNKASEVAILSPSENLSVWHGERVIFEGYEIELLGQCKYFESIKYTVKTEAVFEVDDTSFCSVIILEGKGVISSDKSEFNFSAAESYFIPAGKKKIRIKGQCAFILTHI